MIKRTPGNLGRLLALAVAASVLLPLTPAFSADSGQKSQQWTNAKSDHAAKDKWQGKNKNAKDWKKSDSHKTNGNSMQGSMQGSMQNSMQGSH